MILMNNYTGTGVGYEWSVQMQFNGLTGLVKDFDVAAANQQNRNVVFDQWVPIHVYVDLANGVASATENGQAIAPGASKLRREYSRLVTSTCTPITSLVPVP